MFTMFFLSFLLLHSSSFPFFLNPNLTEAIGMHLLLVLTCNSTCETFFNLIFKIYNLSNIYSMCLWWTTSSALRNTLLHVAKWDVHAGVDCFCSSPSFFVCTDGPFFCFQSQSYYQCNNYIQKNSFSVISQHPSLSDNYYFLLIILLQF